MNLLVYSPQPTPRLDYTLKVFFEQIVQINYRKTQDLTVYKAHQGPCINYSKKGPLNPSEIWIPCHDFIFEDSIRVQDLSYTHYESLPGFFLNDQKKASYPFDLFAIGFYLLSLYETYLPGERDIHGRFTATQSLAYQHNFLNRPLVDEYCLHLLSRIKSKWPDFVVQHPQYAFTPTYDIDVSWAYLNRPVYRQWGSILRDLLKVDFKNLSRRIAVFNRQQEDPFYTFPFLEALHDKYQLAPIYFFLLGDYHGLDRSIDYQHPAQKQLLRGLAQQHQSGIHPSIRSNHQSGQLTEELRRYQQLTGQIPVFSRQHYLILNLPTTYHRLSERGIQHEFSLGYGQMPGFRASIARPFSWYDLASEKESELTLHPFICMDWALRRSAQNQDDQIYDQIKTLITATKAVNGHFYTLWHNSSFSAIDHWQGWKKHYEYIVEQALP